MGKFSVARLRRFESEYTLAAWLVKGDFYRLWDQWVAILAHLRGEIDGRPPPKQFPTATHEFVIYTQHPNHRLYLESGPEAFRPMMPIDVCVHFEAATDGDAMLAAQKAMDALRDGYLHPDIEYSVGWDMVLRYGDEEPGYGQ